MAQSKRSRGLAKNVPSSDSQSTACATKSLAMIFHSNEMSFCRQTSSQARKVVAKYSSKCGSISKTVAVMALGSVSRWQKSATAAAVNEPTPAPASKMRIRELAGRPANIDAINSAMGAGVKNWPNSLRRLLSTRRLASTRQLSTQADNDSAEMDNGKLGGTVTAVNDAILVLIILPTPYELALVPLASNL